METDIIFFFFHKCNQEVYNSLTVSSLEWILPLRKVNNIFPYVQEYSWL